MNFFALGRFAARFQIAATIAKLVACCLIIVTGLHFYWIKGNFCCSIICPNRGVQRLEWKSDWCNGTLQLEFWWFGHGLVWRVITINQFLQQQSANLHFCRLYAYSGWDILNYGTDEIYRPRRYTNTFRKVYLLIVLMVPVGFCWRYRYWFYH